MNAASPEKTLRTAGGQAPVVVVVEDEAQIRHFVKMALEAEGCQVFEAETAKRGLIDSGTRRPDLVVLDLGLPDDDGMDVIRELRAWSDVPIIVLSARTAEAGKIAALDAGADDYLTKPFGAGELLARVRAQLRRQYRGGAGASAAGQNVVEFGAVRLDLSKRMAWRDGEPLHLTPIEYRLLAYLVAHPDCVLTHRQLLKGVWGPSHVDDTHYVRIYMGHLRRKIEADPARPVHLLTESGVGYRFSC
ncbi:DNA-binding response regulator in two-component regulatory system with KdpD [Burkholderiales bacterium]|nr:DNA-binding response regulator in two-component regulatory system with KdpD [Burkholderiales bacterium]